MKVFQPFQYQGSKRGLAPEILQYLPEKMGRVVEPFAGSCAFSIACAARGRAKEYWLNDLNKPLVELVELMIHCPKEVSDYYSAIWCKDQEKALEHYYCAREEFNRTQDPRLLLYLLARCVKGSVRYNSEGFFNQSPDKRRLGTHPETMCENILGISALFRGKAMVTSWDYQDVLAHVRENDIVYMDPPYQGVCGERDSRYLTGISFDEFICALNALNHRNICYAISYDGRLGSRAYGQPMPAGLNLTKVELKAGRSSQATLLGRDEITFESLYLSAQLVKEADSRLRRYSARNSEQMCLFESVS